MCAPRVKVVDVDPVTGVRGKLRPIPPEMSRGLVRDVRD